MYTERRIDTGKGWDELLSVVELAEEMGFSAGHIYKMRKAGFPMPGGVATINEALQWLEGNPGWQKNAPETHGRYESRVPGGDEPLPPKELAAALMRNLSYVYAMRADGFSMPGGRATINQARDWIYAKQWVSDKVKKNK